MNLEKIPPIIAALDCETIDEVNNLIARLQSYELGPDLLGYKIPHWFDQDERLKSELIEGGNYVVLDTQIVNSADKMAVATKAFLRKITAVWMPPSAITIAPALSPSDPGMSIIQNEIVPYAAENGVAIIGFAEQTNSDTGSDNAVMHEARRYINGQVAGFAGHEVHAANLISHNFQEELDLTIKATFRSPSYDANDNRNRWPDLVVSKFNVPTPRSYRLTEDFDNPKERDKKKQKAVMRKSQLNRRVALIAGGVFALDPRIRSVYLGTSVIEHKRPVEFILKILQNREAAMQKSPGQIRTELRSV